ncbi:hypothetical protein B0H12DRAFT_1131568 [Mycena haematopus]|nr:hypothetical protein B0H12DRAFT_1131568 [Mycena haematopus]
MSSPTTTATCMKLPRRRIQMAATTPTTISPAPARTPNAKRSTATRRPTGTARRHRARQPLATISRRTRRRTRMATPGPRMGLPAHPPASPLSRSTARRRRGQPTTRFFSLCCIFSFCAGLGRINALSTLAFGDLMRNLADKYFSFPNDDSRRFASESFKLP